MIKSRIEETGTASGPGGTVTLSGAEAGFGSFTQFGNGVATVYWLVYADKNDGYAWECRRGTVNTGSPNTLGYTATIVSSAGGTTAVSWTAGKTLMVYNEIPAELALWFSATATLAADKGVHLTGATGQVDTHDLTAYARTLLAAANASAARTVLALGTAAVAAVGTSGTALGLLDTANIWSASQTLAATTYIGAAAGAESLRVVTVGSAVNRAQVSGAVAASAVTIDYTGSDTNVFASHATKGAGAHYWFTNSSDRQAAITATASAVNYWAITGAAAAGAVLIGPAGSDTDISATITAKGSGAISLVPSGGRVLRVGSTASAVNYAEVNGGAAGVNTTVGFYVGGSDTNIYHNHYSKGANGHRLWVNSAEQVRIDSVASAVNFALVYGAVTGSWPSYAIGGADTNAGMSVRTKGNAGISVIANAATQFGTGATASAVNYLRADGNITGARPILASTGSDSDVGMSIFTKGTGFLGLYVNNALQATVANVASAVNYWQLAGAATTGNSALTATGSDSNVGALIQCKGTGPISFYLSNSPQVQIASTASAVNYWQFAGAATTAPPTASVQGSDTNINAVIASSKGSGILALYANGAEQMRVGAVASAVNFFRIDGSVTTGQPTQTATGADTNVAGKYVTKGTASQFFYSAAGSDIMFRLSPVGSSVNYLQAEPGATGVTAAPDLAAVGADTDIWLNLYAKGAGGTRFWSNGAEQFRAIGAASAVNKLTAVGSITGGYPTLSSNLSSDTNVGIDVITRGTGPLRIYTNGGTQQVAVSHTANAVNYIQVTGAATGTECVITTIGSDSNPSIALNPKGNGALTLFAGAGSYGGGGKVLFVANCSVVPSSNPTGGGILYIESGALKYRGSGGTITTVAAA